MPRLHATNTTMIYMPVYETDGFEWCDPSCAASLKDSARMNHENSVRLTKSEEDNVLKRIGKFQVIEVPQ